MKYMGSKRSMLTNGLGEVISSEVSKSKRFVDLFTGSGSVAWHVSSNWSKPVVACDLQQFAVSMAEGVVSRTNRFEDLNVFEKWIRAAVNLALSSGCFQAANDIQRKISERVKIAHVADLSREASLFPCAGPTQRAYGGYYFSPLQALYIDALRSTLPVAKAERALALAALIDAASRLAASPGHTAQPFKPNDTAGRYLMECWSREVLLVVRTSLVQINKSAARVEGFGCKCDAVSFAHSLEPTDLVFVDPPYSAVQYSRFYHVLETIASGEHVDVSGTGRYPDKIHRPSSDFSLKTRSRQGLVDLFRGIGCSGANAIVTFPSGKASNGLSGSDIEQVADEYFVIRRRIVTSKFSTLGGNRTNREARQNSEELILSLTAK